MLGFRIFIGKNYLIYTMTLCKMHMNALLISFLEDFSIFKWCASDSSS